jgi:hypothetical protein
MFIRDTPFIDILSPIFSLNYHEPVRRPPTHHHDVNATMLNPDKDLRTVGRDLAYTGRLSPTFKSPQVRVPATVEKAAFLCVNSNTSYRLNLGTCPVNDAVAFGEVLKDYEFDVYFLVRPQAKDLLPLIDAFVKNTTKQFVLFYVGHGHGVLEEVDRSHRAEDAFVFADGVVAEAELIAHLTQFKNPKNEVIFIADACIPGTIWDIQEGTALPPRVLSLSSTGAPAGQGPKFGDSRQNTVFTEVLTKALRAAPEITPIELIDRMRAPLRAIGRTVVVGSSSRELLELPLIQK